MLEPNSLTSNFTTYLKEELGYQFHQNNGYSYFPEFSGFDTEYQSLYEGVGLRDISDSYLFDIIGNDAIDFLHRITTNDLKNLQKNESIKTVVTSEKGRILDSVNLINYKSKILIVGTPENSTKVKSWINKYVIMDDVKTLEKNPADTLLEILGPQADSFLTLICGEKIDGLDCNYLRDVILEDFHFSVMKLKDKNEKLRFWILCQSEQAINIIRYCIENKCVFNFNLIGHNAYETYRIEQGIPAAQELNDNFNPLEANLMNEISFTKGCYIGQEVIARLDSYDKVQKFLTGIEFENFEVPEDAISIFTSNEEKEIGIITSVTNSSALNKKIALAYIKKNYLNNNQELFAKSIVQNREYKVSVKNLPFRR